MNSRNNTGFSLLEVIAALSIIMIVLGGVMWNFPKLKNFGNVHLVIHRAAMLSTAKEAFLREEGFAAFNQYRDSLTNDQKFDLIKHYLPFVGETIHLNKYTPDGFTYDMGSLDSKVIILEQRSGKRIHY